MSSTFLKINSTPNSFKFFELGRIRFDLPRTVDGTEHNLSRVEPTVIRVTPGRIFSGGLDRERPSCRKPLSVRTGKEVLTLLI